MGLYIYMGPGLVLAAGVVFPIVGGILIAFRFRMKMKNNVKLGIEDWLVVPALTLSIGMAIATIIGVSAKSVGYNTPPKTELAYQTYTRAKGSQSYWNIEWMQPLALGCIKLSFIFFYRRIFNVGPNKSVFNIVSIAAIVLMIIWMFGIFLAVMLICPGHVSAFWGPASVRQKYCWSTIKFLYAFTWSDVGTDLIVLLMPIPSVVLIFFSIFSMLMVAKLLGVFAVGAITVAASIIRAVFYLELIATEGNPNMINTNGLYWMLMETGLALIAVNLPPLYGTVKDGGVETVVRSVRSFTSIVSTSSRASSKQNTKDPNVHKTSRSSNGRESIELGPVDFASNAKAARTESLNDLDVESGNINVTKSYTVDRRA
ncbi:hypothetical protein HYFRA_00013969 [Hymenoscyphus fraxineus]|uniref:Rhodopsin domain-containing protein n=1 Tax=Hymenoscyphus fraxineus TaxID=746836 RepID=A0A9N9PZL2_9HELO|nr:hypothetical protein HYFRA_00013969 [Hymenoscyphus fraxineus]